MRISVETSSPPPFAVAARTGFTHYCDSLVIHLSP
jgi:hypothetical protein